MEVKLSSDVRTTAECFCSTEDIGASVYNMNIINLTPHPITIIRRCPDPSGPPEATIEHRTEYPACAPADLPRATEMPDNGEMALTDSGSDGQGGYENIVSLRSTGLVDFVGYAGVEGLPEVSTSDRMFGLTTFRIVSIVTAIGALAAGRGIEDLLVPMGQVRDDKGRIIGATGLAPASSLLAPMYRAIVAPHQEATIKALDERNEARSMQRINHELDRLNQEIAACPDAHGGSDF